MRLLDALAYALLIPSIILHEVSHGAVALAFGDDTARQAGRLTLNPLPHIDPFGSVLLPMLLAVVGAPMFGWAKPVPVNPARMRRPRDHGLMTSLAGPAANIVLAVVAGLLWRWTSPGVVEPLWLQALLLFGAINVVLAVFNLIPLPPLDGSALVERLLPRRWLSTWSRLRQYSMGLLLVLVLLLPGVLNKLFRLVIDLWGRMLV